jgi:hypothetical protein
MFVMAARVFIQNLVFNPALTGAIKTAVKQKRLKKSVFQFAERPF